MKVAEMLNVYLNAWVPSCRMPLFVEADQGCRLLEPLMTLLHEFWCWAQTHKTINAGRRNMASLKNPAKSLLLIFASLH